MYHAINILTDSVSYGKTKSCVGFDTQATQPKAFCGVTNAKRGLRCIESFIHPILQPSIPVIFQYFIPKIFHDVNRYRLS